MSIPLHEKALRLAKTYRTSECELLDTLIEMSERNLFIQMGYLDMFDYLTKALNLSECQSGYFSRVAQRARVIPQFREAVVSGRISLSQGRRVCGMIDQENFEEWINAAESLTQRELEAKVAQKRPRTQVHEGIKPINGDLSEMKVALSDDEEKMLRRVQDLVSQKLKRPASLEDAIREMALCYLEKNDPVKKAERSLALAPSSRTETIEPGSHQIKAGLKHRVHLRDGFRCTAKDSKGNRCETERWLSLHHIKPISLGGE